MSDYKHPLFGDMKLESVTDLGDQVFCDVCNEEYTKDNSTSGGFLFGPYAYCPKCAVSRMLSIVAHNEVQHIKEACPKDMSYYDWVMKLRGGDNTIKVYTSGGPS